MLRHLYHLHVFCDYVPKLKAYYPTADEADEGAAKHFREYFPWDLVVDKLGVTKTCRLIEDGYVIKKVREDKLFLFKEGFKPMRHPIEHYFKPRNEDEDIEVLYDDEGNELESID